MSFTVRTAHENIHGTSWGPFPTIAAAADFIGEREDLYVVDNSKVEGEVGRYPEHRSIA